MIKYLSFLAIQAQCPSDAVLWSNLTSKFQDIIFLTAKITLNFYNISLIFPVFLSQPVHLLIYLYF